MAKVYEVEGTFYVRSGTPEQWSSESVEGGELYEFLVRVR